MQLQQLVAEVNDIGRQIADRMGVPFDESNVFVYPYNKNELAIQYKSEGRNGEVVIEIIRNEIEYYDPDDITILELNI